MSNIPIFLSSDNNYAPFVASTIASTCVNTMSNCIFYVLDGGISTENKNKILELKSTFANLKIEFLPIDIKKVFGGLTCDTKYISLATYSRFLISELKPNIRKYIYLDVDVIVAGDIQQLFDEDLDGFVLGAGKDVDYDKRNRNFLTDEHLYFNAGVLLIDGKKWRQQNITQKLFEIEKKYHDELIFADQDILNKYFECNYKVLNSKYNAIDGKQQNTVIRHYAGFLKPWYNKESLKADFVKDNNIFWEYAKLTNFYADIVQIKIPEEIKEIFYIWGYNKPLKDDTQIIQVENSNEELNNLLEKGKTIIKLISSVISKSITSIKSKRKNDNSEI